MSTSSLAVSAPTASWRARLSGLLAEISIDRNLMAMFVASRLLVVVAAFVAENLIPRNPGLIPGADGPLLRSLTSWDGFYYLGIARDGYQAAPVVGAYSNGASPPLFPPLVRVLSVSFPRAQEIVAGVTSSVAFLVARGLLV